MTKQSTVAISTRTVPRYFAGTFRVRTIVALTTLACWALISVPANAACNNTAREQREAHSLQPQGQAQPVSGNAADDDDDASIVGLWHVYFTAGGQAFDEGFDQWHSDGTEILNDTAPPQPANGAGTICLGVYKKIRPRTYKLRHPFWSFDDKGNLSGSGVFLEVVSVDKTGNSYTGTFAFITYDLNGNTTFQVTGDIKAQRITVD